MELVGLMLVRNEADIVRTNLLHHLAQGIDRFLVVDNGSTDGTDRVLAELARGGRVRWTRDDGPYRQAEITTELAREAFRGGADWVLPIDADEFWYAPRGGLRRVLVESSAGALEVQVVNFVQRRDQLERSPTALLHMTRRPPQPIGPVGPVGPDGPIGRAVQLIEARQVAYIEVLYTAKWISKPTATIEIAMGDHRVSGVAGPLAETEEIICLHAPLRARAVLQARMVDHGRRAHALGRAGKIWWNALRWRRLAETTDLEHALEREWAANSYADDCLDVYGVRHPLVYDTRLRDLLRPWIEPTRPQSVEITLKVPSSPSMATPGIIARPQGAVGSILARMRSIEGWLYDAEAGLLMTMVTLALAEHQPHAVVEVGSYCGRSTVVLGSVAQALCPSTRVYAIDPHEGEISSAGGETRMEPPTLERFRSNIAEAGLTSIVEVIQNRSFEVAWDKPISLLFIDGLHDYLNVSRDFAHFAPWVVDGGYVAFDDYDHNSFPGVVACVNEVLDSGRYRKVRRIGRVVVIQKLPSSSPEGERAVSGPAASSPAATVVRDILEEGIGPLQAALDERTEWAELMEQEAARRGAVIQELQAALEEQQELARQRLATIKELEAQVERLRTDGGRACTQSG